MMKNIFKSLFILLIMLFPICLKAKGYIDVSTKSITIEVGESKTFNIISNNAVGDVIIKSSDNSIVKLSNYEWTTGIVKDNVKKSDIITVKGLKIGTCTLTLTIDGATFDNEDLSGQNKKIYVSVIEKKDNTKSKNKSTNNKLKNISVEGFELNKLNSNSYTLFVDEDVENINIKATAEDKKATITGLGSYKLLYGDNSIDIIVKSEAGSLNVINIKIHRDGDESKINKNDDLNPINEFDNKEDNIKNTINNKYIGLSIIVLLVVIIIFILRRKK